MPPHVQVWEGAGVVKSARKLIGATNPLESEPGTIRGDFAVQVRLAVVGCAVVWCGVVCSGVVWCVWHIAMCWVC
jgi:nucleoside diphosphate kinase